MRSSSPGKPGGKKAAAAAMFSAKGTPMQAIELQQYGKKTVISILHRPLRHFF